MDLALALVAEDHGSQLATDTARQLVMYVRRNGGQSQFSAQLAAQTVDSPALAELLGWMGDHLEADLSVAALARRVHLSERQFARTFRATTNSTPASHVEALRVEAARRLLETTDQPVERIARRCGFGTPDTMHRAFRRRLDVTPSDYRRHFQAAS
jgi:transcriptional regulator GlxA family with amidase domain